MITHIFLRLQDILVYLRELSIFMAEEKKGWVNKILSE
jgi:hypothetical protein